MKRQYLLFHKPWGVLSQFTPEPGAPHKTLGEYIPETDVYPCGRLDHDSEGLLLLTNAMPLRHRLMDPEFGHPRTYWVQVERDPDEAALERLRRGVEIKNRQCRPVEVRRLEREPDLEPRDPPIRYRKNVPTVWLEITMREGRNRQVRRMTAAVGHPTLRLVRSAIGPLLLDGLRRGHWRFLGREEVAALEQRGQEVGSL